MSFSKKIVTTYAKALFETISSLEKKKECVNFEHSRMVNSTEPRVSLLTTAGTAEEISVIRSFICASTALKTIFNNPTLPEKQKLEIISNIFCGSSKMTKAFLKILTEKSHLNLLPEISDEYNEILAKFENSTKVKLITASILEENYGFLLLNTLKKITQSEEILLEVSYNPQLLGGLIIEYNSKSIDASILKEFSFFFDEM